ncbi:MAG: exo-alpha-sialidase [bacterium]|nr:exo-alpha-sialidase [bacterium]
MTRNGKLARATVLFAVAVLVMLVGCSRAARRDGPVDPRDVSAEDWKGPPRHDRFGEAPVLRSTTRRPVTRAEGSFAGTPDSLGNDVQVNVPNPIEDQNETSIMINPIDKNNIVVGWNNYNTGDNRNTILGFGRSLDGGASWVSSIYDPSALAGVSTGDPALAADSQGNFYLGLLAYLGGGQNGIYCAKSTDGGLSFGNPTQVDSGGDKEYLVVDPATDDIYMFWENSHPTSDQAIWFSKSTDGNQTWSPRVAITDSVVREQNGAVPVVGPAGQLYVLWTDFDNDRLLFDRSLDGGATFVSPDIVAAQVTQPASPLDGDGPFRNPLLPSLAVDGTAGPHSGNLYAVWGDGRNGDPDVMVTVSSDGGDTWSAPVRLNDDPLGNGLDQFQPWAVVDGLGNVHVTWLDKRRDAGNMLVDVYTTMSANGGQDWGPNARVTDVNTTALSTSSGGFFGDYTGLAASGQHVYPVFPDARLGDQDIFINRIDALDYDGDTAKNDGDNSGILGDAPCSTGQSGCDDNCPADPNPQQEDGDLDTVGDICDLCPTVFNPDQNRIVFDLTLAAPSTVSLSWGAPRDVRFAKGPLDNVRNYGVFTNGNLAGASGLDLSADNPAVGQGLYYIVRAAVCGSWQTLFGDQPERDADLP